MNAAPPALGARISAFNDGTTVVLLPPKPAFGMAATAEMVRWVRAPLPKERIARSGGTWKILFLGGGGSGGGGAGDLLVDQRAELEQTKFTVAGRGIGMVRVLIGTNEYQQDFYHGDRHGRSSRAAKDAGRDERCTGQQVVRLSASC